MYTEKTGQRSSSLEEIFTVKSQWNTEILHQSFQGAETNTELPARTKASSPWKTAFLKFRVLVTKSKFQEPPVLGELLSWRMQHSNHGAEHSYGHYIPGHI